ncbi:MAG TPA: serine/threonine-protein kinase [Gaiellaceae bacterium]|nr:serine/threonine-protein kinase [Gaiellaceae bacterium]
MAHENDILPPRYKNARRIGYGGMGEIFQAEDEVLGRTVAIKVLAERYARDEALRARFTREALAAARLSAEPSTITIFDVGEWRGRPFIVMEHLEGGSLEERLRDGKPSTAQALDWLEQAADALDAAHRNGVVHRDIKPGNLLLDHDDSLRVADFGIASAAGMDSLTMTGTVLGTAGYLSPEQAQGERAGPASDRYALGVVAFELLTGRRPFESDSPTAEAAAHINAEIPFVSERLDPVFRRALAKDPGQRFGTSAELVRALRNALDPGSLTTRPLDPVRRRRSRVPLVVSFVAAAALAGAGLAAILADRGEGTATPTPSTRVTTHQSAQPPPPTRPPPPPPARDGVALTDQATRLLQAGDYSGAERIAQEAVAALHGSGQTYEAYAEYDLGQALAQLGRCDEALPHLDRSQQLQGQRKEIDEARRGCEKGKKKKGHRVR